MAQPPRFVDPRFSDHVCRLKKALYGLRQAPLTWFHRLSAFSLSLRYHGSRSDSSLFYFHQGTAVIDLLLYIDNTILTGNDPALLRRFVTRTNVEFVIKDLGKINYFLGLEISYTSSGLFIGQSKYAHDILKRAQLVDSNPIATPLVASETLISFSTPFHDPTLYSSRIGALQYLTITRQDLSYSMNLVSHNFYIPLPKIISHL